MMNNVAGAGTFLDGAAVRLTGLHKNFGHIKAVRGVDLDIAPGEVIAFLGPNGAGKSTTIDMLLGLTKPDAGAVTGGTAAQIAARLFLSEGTVRNHLSSVIGKTGARTRADAVRIATERGWI